MRILFVSSTTGGGSGRSQRELARQLQLRGHEVRFLVDDKRPDRLRRWWYEQLSDATVRFGSTPAGRALALIERLPGARPDRRVIDGIPHFITPVPENAFERLAAKWQPDLVVGNSIARLAWRKIRGQCRGLGVATILYVREASAQGHLNTTDDVADVVVANAGSLQAEVQARGRECELIPSVVDLSITSTATDRTRVLLLNPIESHGIKIFWEIAERMPDVQFRIQESWPLNTEQLAHVERLLAVAPHVEFLRRVEPGPELYSTARLLLVPHQLDNRPRVILEAQSNGIPVLASDYPGLVEAVGEGGIILPADDPSSWVKVIARLNADAAMYEQLCTAALAHAQRPEVVPSLIIDRFETTLQLAVSRASSRSAPPHK